MIRNKGNIITDYKTILIVIGLIFMSITSIAIAKQQEDINQIEITYSFENPKLNKVQIENNVYDEVILSGASNIGNPGDPSLPIKGAYLLLPQGTDLQNIIISTSDKLCLGNNFLVKPVVLIICLPYYKKTHGDFPLLSHVRGCFAPLILWGRR